MEVTTYTYHMFVPSTYTHPLSHIHNLLPSTNKHSLHTPSFSLPSSHTPRRQVRRLPEEEICLQTSLHLSSWQRYRLWPPGSSQLAVQRTVLREADCEFRERQSVMLPCAVIGASLSEPHTSGTALQDEAKRHVTMCYNIC